jgi:type IV pilus assembly protein PilV
VSHGPCACRPRGRQGGASLIEVLVSLVLVAFTMLGLLGLQLRTQSFQKDSIDRRNAAIIASDFLERAAANFTGFRNGLYNGLSHDVGAEAPVPPAACANALICTDTEIRNWDWFALRRNVSTRLPGGIAFVTSPVLTGGTRASRVQVTVGWIDPSRADPNLSVGTPQRDPECPASVTDTRYSCFSVRSFP